MYKTKVVTLLKSLSREDKIQLRKFVKGFSLSDDTAVRMCDYILQQRTITKVTLDKHKVYEYIYEGQGVYKDASLRVIRNKLLKIVEDFLVYTKLKKDKIQYNLALADTYKDKGLDTYFEQHLNAVKKYQEKDNSKSIEHYYNNYKLHLERSKFIFNQKQHRSVSVDLQAVTDELSKFFIAAQLREACSMLSHQTVYNTKYNTNFFSTILPLVVEYGFLEEPIIALYYHSYQALKNPEQEIHFHNFKEQLFEYSEHISPSESRDIYMLGVNYCIKRYNNGKTSFLRDLFELYQKGFEDGALLDNGILSRWTYKNVVTAGIRLKEFEQTEKFIKTYRLNIEKKYREHSYMYNLAKLYYAKGDKNKAMTLLIQVDFDDLLLNLDGKRMLVKIYYELGEFDVLESFLASFRNFIYRQKVIAYHRNNYLNIIRIVALLIGVNSNDKQALEDLKTTIEKTEILTEREWLLEQVNKMDKN